MPRKTTLADRLVIGELAQAGLTDPQIAQRLSLHWSTVRKWRRRGWQGRAALASRLGRPPRGVWAAPLPAVQQVRETVLAWRRAHPGWGAKTLRAELQRDPRFAAGPLPSPATLGRLLREAGLTRRYQRHTELPARPHSQPRVPHQQWELDAAGETAVPGVGLVALIQLNDCYSHLRLLSYPCWVGERRVEHQPSTADYQLALRLAFQQWGLPERLRVDHGRVFYDSESASPFPTRLHLWLVALGIELVYGRVRQPTDQGLTERSHQLWSAQVLEGQTFGGWAALYQALQERREFLNRHLPCTGTQDLPPLVAHPEALRARREYRPHWEAELLELARLERYLEQCRWCRRISRGGTISLGGHLYYLGKRCQGQEVEIRFAGDPHQLVLWDASGAEVGRFPLKGYGKAELMGELAPIYQLPGYQPTLPFTYADWRAVRLCETLAGTT